MGAIAAGFKIYSLAEVQYTVYQSRFDGTDTWVYYLKFASGLRCALVYKPDAFGMQHIEFFALSDGWEGFTTTGYKSHFCQYRNKAGLIPSYQQIQSYWHQVCRADGFDVAEEKPPFQVSLF